MARPIPYDSRVKIVRDHALGKSPQSIADEMGLSKSGVKKILSRYRQQGECAFTADYSACGRSCRQHFDGEIEAEIVCRRSGLAGAPFVHTVLREAHPDRRIPSVGTIQRRWKQAGGRLKAVAGERQRTHTWSKEVHHTWQVDGKEQIALGNGQQVSWVNIADEASSAVLHTEVFPPAGNDPSATSLDVQSTPSLF